MVQALLGVDDVNCRVAAPELVLLGRTQHAIIFVGAIEKRTYARTILTLHAYSFSTLFSSSLPTNRDGHTHTTLSALSGTIPPRKRTLRM
jgi:hypothetical protein